MTPRYIETVTQFLISHGRGKFARRFRKCARRSLHFFFTIKKNNGRESHHFQCWLFRFDRRKVKPSGAGYFYCSERTCKAAIRVNYVEENEEPSHIHVTNSKHNHQPDITMNYVVHCKRIIRDAIEKDPIEPVENLRGTSCKDDGGYPDIRR